jgi:hypothetical protein
MNCSDCQEWVQRQLDGEPVPRSPELDAHVAQCEDCQALLLAADRLREGLRLLPAPNAPEWLLQRTTQAVLGQRSRVIRWRFAASAMAAAACMLLATWWDLKTPSSGTGQVEIASKSRSNIAPDPSLGEMAKASRIKLDELTAKAWDQAHEQAAVLADASAVLAGVRIDDPSPEEPARVAPRRSGLSIAMKSIKTTTRRGLGFLDLGFSK